METPEDIFQYQPWSLVNGTVLEFETHRPHSNELLVKLKGINSPEEAKKLANKEFSIPRNQLPPPTEGHYYWMDLEGLSVIDQQEKALGTVQGLFNHGASDVMIVQNDIGETLLPFIDDVIKSVDFETKTIRVDWDMSEE